MGRSSRAKRERRATVREGDTLYGLTGQGQEFRPHPREMPRKRPGEHRWVATVMHTLSQSAARKAHHNEENVLLDMESIVAFGVGCFDCERSFPEIEESGDWVCTAKEWMDGDPIG